MSELRPASELAEKGSKPFPRESAGYRDARAKLLKHEIELRRQIQRVAALRRELPDGSEASDYRFLDADGKEHRFADLFGRHDTLVTYFWMYGPERERPCPMCTSFVGSLDIPSVDIEQRVALAIIGRSPVSRQLDFARERGWKNLKFYQTVGDDFARDYRGLHDDGSEWAICASWKRQGDKVRLFWAAEGDFETADPGFDPHLAPDPTPLWNILDWTPGGRGSDWYPKLEYDS
jgi:predicted dithiol-disulfide oxidoreductase (DUF899 family)